MQNMSLEKNNLKLKSILSILKAPNFRGVTSSSSHSFTSIWVFPKIVVFPQKWMVKIMEIHLEIPIRMDDLGGYPPIFGNTHIILPEKKHLVPSYIFIPLAFFAASSLAFFGTSRMS